MNWNRAIDAFVQPGLLNRLAFPLTLVLLAVAAYQLAALTLLWLPWPEPRLSLTAVDKPLSSSPAVGVADAIPDAAQIADWHLFGVVAQVPAPQPVTAAPETRLNLRLAGIFYRADRSALALIAEGSGPEQIYRVGDALTGGVTVHQIQADKVILARAGQLEALSLPRESDNEPIAVNTTAPTATSLGAPQLVEAGQIAGLLREQIAANPAALETLAFATPHMEQGQFAGLRLRPGRDRRLLGRLGLRSGDILTELNGVRLTDPIQGLGLLRDMFNNQQVDAKIVRNGQAIPYTFLLTQ